MFLLLSLVNHSLSENRGPWSWQRPKGAVCVPGGAAKPPPEMCPGSKEPSVCKVALSITVWPQSFKSTSLCCAQIFILRLLSRVLMSPLQQHKLHWLSLVAPLLSMYLKKDLSPRLPLSFQSCCQPRPRAAHTSVQPRFSERSTVTALPAALGSTCTWICPLSVLEPLHSMSSGSFTKSAEGDKFPVIGQTVGTTLPWPTHLPSDIPRYWALMVRASCRERWHPDSHE